VIIKAGNHGDGIRSDCLVSLELRDSVGIDIKVKSKVTSMYGDSIKILLQEGLRFFEIQNAGLTIEDSGALPFIIRARLEAAVKRAKPEITTQWLPELRAECLYKTVRERFRRSRLYLPGNTPKFMINAGIHKPDGIILDLEDSVAPTEKDAARILVRNGLRQVDFYGAERMVRINQIPEGLEDLEYIIPHNVHVILIPKCENPEQVRQVDAKITEIMEKKKNSNEVFLMPIIESALGAINAFPIAKASPRNVALTIGLEDYTADIGTRRTNKGRESFWARSQVVNAARAAGLQPIDTVFSDVADEQGLLQSVFEAKSLGFEGKGCIHPRQIKVIHKGFLPTDQEVEKAKKIMAAFEQAKAQGSSVTVVGSKMIDPPVVKRAQRILKLVEG